MQRSASVRVCALSDGPTAPPRCARSAARACPCRRQRRKPPVARIHDERRSKRRLLAVVLTLPDRIVVVDVVLRLREELVHPLLGVGGRLFGGEDCLLAELGRTLERRDRIVGPEALEIGVTVNRSRYGRAGGIASANLDGLCPATVESDSAATATAAGMTTARWFMDPPPREILRQSLPKEAAFRPDPGIRSGFQSEPALGRCPCRPRARPCAQMRATVLHLGDLRVRVVD